MTNTTQPNIEVKEIGYARMTLAVPLSDEELIATGRRLGELDDERRRLARALRDEEEERQVRVMMRADLTEGAMEFVDKAGAVLKTRALSAEERDQYAQHELPLDLPLPADVEKDPEPGDEVIDTDALQQATEEGLDVPASEAIAWAAELDHPTAVELARNHEAANRNRPMVLQAIDWSDKALSIANVVGGRGDG